MWFPELSSGVLESIILIYKAHPHSREVSPKAVGSTPVALLLEICEESLSASVASEYRHSAHGARSTLRGFSIGRFPLS